MNNEIILGIDLGTTNSVASFWDGSTYKIIKNKDSLTFPSIIEFSKCGKIISKDNNENVIRNFKRVIGKSPTDPETLKIVTDLNYNVEISEDISRKIKIKKKN